MSDSDPPDLSGLPRLKDTIRAHGLDADKRLGQHFLLDPAILRAIARSAGNLRDCNVLEIGPGPGGLTRALLAEGARVTAVERDGRCVQALQQLVDAANSRLKLLEADALDIDADVIMDGKSYLIVANLPYNVGNELLVRWLRRARGIIDMRLMFQREVVDRLCAAPRSSAYGRLSILAQTVCGVERVMDLPAGAFHPPPKVRSALVALRPRDPRPSEKLMSALEQLTGAAFQQRRKMLRSSLKPLGVKVDALLEGSGVDATSRAEELDVDTFGDLARQLVTLRRAAP